MERYTTALLILAVLLGGFYLYQMGYIPRAGASVVAFQQIAQGENASIDRRVNYRIKTADELAHLWASLNASSTPPAIDFSKSEVAAVFAGAAPSAGYGVGVIKVVDSNDVRTVLVELKRPETECTLMVGPVSPYELIVLPKTTLPFTHTDEPVTVACPQ